MLSNGLGFPGIPAAAEERHDFKEKKGLVFFENYVHHFLPFLKITN
jgi:hypothetical protein